MIFIDIGIALLAGLAQFVTAYLGWKMTITPGLADNRKNRRKYQLIFWVAGVVGILAVALAAFRAEDVSRQIKLLQRQLNSNSLSVRPDFREHDAYKIGKIEAGKPLGIRVSLKNLGSTDAIDLKKFFIAGTAPNDGDYDAVLLGSIMALGEQMKKSDPEIVPIVRPDEVLTFTVNTEPLSEEAVQRLKSGRSRLYIFGQILHLDPDRGPHYRASFCKYFVGDFTKPQPCKDTHAYEPDR